MSTIKNHINTYADLTAYNNDMGKDYPNVSYIEEDDIVLFEGIRYEEQYFTIESLEDDNAVKFKLSATTGTPSASSAKTISVSTDDGKTWTDYTSTANGTTIATLNMGEKVLIKGNNDTYYTRGSGSWDSGNYFNCFTASNQIDINGNIMSLIYGDNFKEQYSFPSGTTNNFYSMFENSPVVSAENLVLPATTLANACYANMFNGCTSLTTAPKLPATTLASNCYNWMFANTNVLPDCSNIDFTSETVVSSGGLKGLFSGTKVTDSDLDRLLPKNANGKYCLPATTLTDSCYYSMFYGCTSLTTAPVLPATTLANACYMYMFKGCTSLITAPALPATTLTTQCYTNMFDGCTSLTTTPVLPATTLANACYANMFNGCTSLTTAPKLPATTLASNCYNWMFANTNVLPDCSNIDFTSETVVSSGGLKGLFSGTKVTDSDLDRLLPKNANGKYCLPATTLTDSCYYSMFYGCTSLTTAPVLPATTLAQSCYYEMFYGCTSLTTAPVLPATTLAQSCYDEMFYGCTSLTTAPELPATTLAQSCCSSMFCGCTSLTTAPQLPATTIASGCYQNMFNGCTSLITAPKLPATTLANNCYAHMFMGCTSLTTAPALSATALAQSCYSSMFDGCTSLTTAPQLPATTLAQSCCSSMFRNCTSLTTAPALSARTLVKNCYYYMFYGCKNLNYIKAMFTTKPSTIYTSNWVSGVAASGTFVKNSAATWNVTGVNGVPSDWTIQKASS